jgi:UDP-2,3-diacylglucosamine pyrophosphatase LpxH
MERKQYLNLRAKQRVLVLSDLHIGSGVENIDSVFSLIEKYDFVIFNGDIFELYVKDFDELMRENTVARKLHRWMILNQYKCFYVLGNHDIFIKDQNIGVGLTESVVINLKGWTEQIVVMHGHQFDKTNNDPKS